MAKSSAKEQLASGEVRVCTTVKGKTITKRVVVPHWLFDLATHTDEFIFENFQNLDGRQNIPEMSQALFNGLIINLRAENR